MQSIFEMWKSAIWACSTSLRSCGALFLESWVDLLSSCAWKQEESQSLESLLPLHIIFPHSPFTFFLRLADPRGLLLSAETPLRTDFNQFFGVNAADCLFTVLVLRCRNMPSRVSVAILRFNCVFFLAASHVKSSEPDYLFPDTEQGLCFHAKELYKYVEVYFTCCFIYW